MRSTRAFVVSFPDWSLNTVILKEMSPQFAKLYSDVGRPSIAPAQFGARLRFSRHSRRCLEVSWQ